MKERAEQWLARVRAAHPAASASSFEDALTVELVWFQALRAHERGNGEKLAELMRGDSPIPPVARAHVLHLLEHGRPARPARRPRKLTADDAVHMVLFCKIFHGTGFCNKNGPEGNESFGEVADLYGVTPDYIRRLYYGVPQDERDRKEEDLRRQRTPPE